MIMENSKTTITLNRDIFTRAQSMREKASAQLDSRINWDSCLEGLCECATKHETDYMEAVKRTTTMAKMKCKVCGEVLGSMRELQLHFRSKHKNEEVLFTLLE